MVSLLVAGGQMYHPRFLIVRTTSDQRLYGELVKRSVTMNADQNMHCASPQPRPARLRGLSPTLQGYKEQT